MDLEGSYSFFCPSDLEAEGRKQVVFERFVLFCASMNCMVSESVVSIHVIHLDS